jgi:excisionase family DNA binding protein
MNNVIRLPVSEAARLFGVNPRTIRRAIAVGELNYIVVQSRYKINFESLVKWSQKRATIKNKNEKFGIGQFVEKWKIKNKHYSPNPQAISTNPTETQKIDKKEA